MNGVLKTHISCQHLEFEMKKGLLMQMVAKFFGEISNRLVDAVSAEAEKRYKQA